MSRLRQYFANRYGSAQATSDEFESIIRYLNAAEAGNKTLGELMDLLFDENGNVSLGLGFRFNPSTGLEFTTDTNSGQWKLLVAADAIRGVSGQNVGTIEAPLFSNRVDVTATAGQTEFDYVPTDASSNIIVWVNGVLRPMAGYGYAAGVLTLTVPVGAGDLVTIATVRSNPAATYRRVDLTAAAGQVTFPFPHTATEELAIFRNGVFQREGGGYDYIKSPTTGTITMTTSQTAGNIITIMVISNSMIRDVAGLMLEDKYATNGLIRLDRVNIPDGSIAKSKVSGLEIDLASKAKISVSPTAPLTPGQGDLWVNTGYAVPSLLFYDGVRWLNSSPNSLLPLPLAANALQFVRLNSTATALEYAPFDTSDLVKSDTIGVANGVAALDSSGKLPSASVPAFVTKTPITGRIPGAIANGTIVVGHLEGAQHSFVGLSAKLTSGTCTIQLSIGGTLVGGTLAVTSTAAKIAIVPTAVDATAAVKDVAIVVTGGTSPVDLTFNINNEVVG